MRRSIRVSITFNGDFKKEKSIEVTFDGESRKPAHLIRETAKGILQILLDYLSDTEIERLTNYE